MKRVLLLFCVLSLILSGCGGGGKVSEAEIIVGQSLRFTEEDIENAMDAVMEHFRENFEDCILTRMEYNESRSWVKAIEWAQRYDADEAIILLSDFDVSEDSTSYSLGPGTSHADFTWILTRDEGGEWELRSWGYAP